MKKTRIFAATLCAVILLCGFATPAYAGGGEEPVDGIGGADLWEGLDPATTAPAPAPELTPDPNPFTTSGTGTVVDNATDEDGKEFFTIQTPAENVFYLIIDRQRETENVYFLNAVTEADLLALAELPEEPTISTPVPELEPTPDEESVPEQPDKQSGGNMGTLLLVAAVVLLGGGAAWYFKIYRPKHQRAAEPEEDYDETELDDGEAPWDADGGEEEPKE